MESFWPIVPSVLWFGLVVVLLCRFRDQLRSTIGQLASAIIWRVKTGAKVRIASFELGESYVSRDQPISKEGGPIEVRDDTGLQRYQQRYDYYYPNRDLFLVHRLAPSDRPNQLYGVLIYLIPHKDATLAGVRRVEYYFGRHWGDRVFVSTDRASGFSITTSAYGPFVCSAKLCFTDGTAAMIWRYIDFEMGPIGKG